MVQEAQTHEEQTEAWRNFTPQELARHARGLAQALQEGRVPSPGPVISFLKNVGGAFDSLPIDAFMEPGIIALPPLPEGHFPEDHDEYMRQVNGDLATRPRRKRKQVK